MLANGLDAGHLQPLSFEGTAELEIYAEHVQVIGKDEAAFLAMAEVRGWYVAPDERGRFQRLATERIGADHVLNTAGVFVLAIRASLLTVDERSYPSAARTSPTSSTQTSTRSTVAGIVAITLSVRRSTFTRTA